MFRLYFIIVSVLTLKANSYKPNRSAKVNVADIVPVDNFPEVEYPTSIVDSKPFYFNLSPFSNDVQTSFKSLASGGTTKPTPTIILNIKSGDNQKEKNRETSFESEKGVESKTIASTEKDMDTNEQRKGTTTEYPFYEDLEDDFVPQENKKATTSEETDDFILLNSSEDSAEFGPILSDIETEFIDITNSTMQIFDSEHSNEITTITSDVTSINKDSVVNLNECSTLTEMNLFDDSTNRSSVAYLLINEGINDTSLSNDTQGDFIIGMIETAMT